MLIKKDLITAKTEEGIREQVLSQLREKGCIIVSSANQARESRRGKEEKGSGKS